MSRITSVALVQTSNVYSIVISQRGTDEKQISIPVSEFGNLMFILKSVDEQLRGNRTNAWGTSFKQADVGEPIPTCPANSEMDIPSLSSEESNASNPNYENHNSSKSIYSYSNEAGIPVYSDYDPLLVAPHEEYDPETNFHVPLARKRGATTEREDKKRICVKEDLLELISLELCYRFRQKTAERCVGCLLGMDNEHTTFCKKPRKEKIEEIFDELYDSIDNNELKHKLMEKRKTAGQEYSQDMFVDTNTLSKNSAWMRKLKTRMDRYM